MWYDERSSLGGLLELVVQNYEDDREGYWSDDPTESSVVELIDEMATALRTASSDLQQTSRTIFGVEFEWSSIRAITQDESVRRRALEKLEIDVAYDVVGQTRAMGERSFALTQYVLEARPNESVLRFIRRLARCYIAGFTAECVMVCRSVLENAIVEKFDTKRVPLPATQEGKSPMRVRIDAAKMFGWLSADGAADAWDVWIRGNTAVHKDPDAVRDADDTVRATMRVLAELYA